MVLNRSSPLFTSMTQGAGNCLGNMALTSDADSMLKQTFVMNSLIDLLPSFSSLLEYHLPRKLFMKSYRNPLNNLLTQLYFL